MPFLFTETGAVVLINLGPAGREPVMKIVLAEGRSDVRTALRALLEEDGSLRVVAEAVDADQVAGVLEASCPDLILLEWEICRKRSPRVLAEWAGLCPGIQIIAMSSDPKVGPQALAAGARAYVCKCDSPDRLLEAVREVQGLRGAPEREA